MVRGRKTRAAATSANLSRNIIDDKCCASPKRKDCKLDSSLTTTTTDKLTKILSSDIKDDTTKRRPSTITNYFHVVQPKETSNNQICVAGHQDVDENARDPFFINKSENSSNTNIFLQAPVLHLNIDKSPNQASSIVINKHIDFATLATSGLVSFTTKSPPPMIMANTTRTPFTCDKFLRSQRARTIESEDSSVSSDSNNSCDSGVVIDNSSLEMSPSKRRKPTTPHRILCPSPVKHVVVEKTPSSQLSNLNIGTKKVTKSRRRLNVNPTEIETEIENFIEPSQPTSIITNNKKSSTIASTKKAILNTVADPSAQQNTNNNCKTTKLTDFFPVRRSVRKTKKAVEQEQLRSIETAIRNEQEDGLLVKKFPEKGRGVITTRPFAKGEFVIEYIGDLIDIHEANKREQMYAKDENTGCYMYYFKHKNQQYCIDATPESGKMGRLVNHSRNGNLITKTVFYRNRPHLVLIAKEDIGIDEELTYDYGDRSKEALQHHPWLAL